MLLSLTFINALLSQPPYPFQLPLINNPISLLARNNNIVNENPYLFNHEISYKVPITDQKSSGRCWLFASLNLVRLVTLQNWNQTDLGKEFDIYQEDGELVGQQYPSDTGPIDILAISKDKKTLLVVELKKGRVSDTVVGQIQRYMGYVKDELAEPNQVVKGIIIGSEDDNKIRRALSVTVNIEFYRYQVSFKLFASNK
jgi:hypothetical protein